MQTQHKQHHSGLAASQVLITSNDGRWEAVLRPPFSMLGVPRCSHSAGWRMPSPTLPPASTTAPVRIHSSHAGCSHHACQLLKQLQLSSAVLPQTSRAAQHYPRVITWRHKPSQFQCLLCCLPQVQDVLYDEHIMRECLHSPGAPAAASHKCLDSLLAGAETQCRCSMHPQPARGQTHTMLYDNQKIQVFCASVLR
jgi:hypothetical protein